MKQLDGISGRPEIDTGHRRFSVIAPLRLLVRNHWKVLVAAFVVWGFAFTRVMVEPTPRLPLLFNITPSLPYYVAWLEHTDLIVRGDYIIYSFDGAEQQVYPGLRAQPFFKQVRGIPGDRVSVQTRNVFINGAFVGMAKSTTFDGHPLDPIYPTVIPAGYFYVQGTHSDSFDSRYQQSGLVRVDHVIGRVRPIF